MVWNYLPSTKFEDVHRTVVELRSSRSSIPRRTISTLSVLWRQKIQSVKIYATKLGIGNLFEINKFTTIAKNAPPPPRCTQNAPWKFENKSRIGSLHSKSGFLSLFSFFCQIVLENKFADSIVDIWSEKFRKKSSIK